MKHIFASEERKDLAADDSTIKARQQLSDYDNDYHRSLYKVCDWGYGMTQVASEYEKKKVDRQWRWECRQVVQNSYPSCYWSSYENIFYEPILFMCGKDRYLGGVESYFMSHYRDRRWRFVCCRADGYITKSCEITSYTNTWEGLMNFQAREGSVITGVFSHHDNDKE